MFFRIFSQRNCYSELSEITEEGVWFKHVLRLTMCNKGLRKLLNCSGGRVIVEGDGRRVVVLKLNNSKAYFEFPWRAFSCFKLVAIFSKNCRFG